MRYILLGLLAGIILGLIPVNKYETGIQIFAEWSGSISNVSNIKASPYDYAKDSSNGINTDNELIILKGNGEIKFQKVFDEGILHATSGNFENYITYEKLGKDISFSNLSGEIYWKHSTPQYPYISYNSKLILLLIADLSGVKLFDFNLSSIGAEAISGKLLNSIYFTKKNDFASIGFLDGSYYAIDKDGNIIFTGEAPDNSSVKTTTLSNNGKYIAVHYGNIDSDKLIITDIENEKSQTFDLMQRHLTKTGLAISNNGFCAVIDNKSINLINFKKDSVLLHKTGEKAPGQCSISCFNGIFAAAYRENTGSRFVLFNEKGNVYKNIKFEKENFLKSDINEKSILLRGIDNLYCYSYQH